MKKKTIILTVFVAVLILVLVLVFLLTMRGKKEEVYEGEIISISYSYGSYNGGYWNYEIYKENQKTFVKAKGWNGVELNLNKQVDNNVLDDISQIVKEKEIYKWYGFNKEDKNVLDGYSFSLTIKYSDGKEGKASGYMKYPNNYTSAHKELTNYLETIK